MLILLTELALCGGCCLHVGFDDGGGDAGTCDGATTGCVPVPPDGGGDAGTCDGGTTGCVPTPVDGGGADAGACDAGAGGLWSGWRLDGGACDYSACGEQGPGITFCADPYNGRGQTCFMGAPCEQFICPNCDFADGEALIGKLLDGGAVKSCGFAGIASGFACTQGQAYCIETDGQSVLSQRCYSAVTSILNLASGCHYSNDGLPGFTDGAICGWPLCPDCDFLDFDALAAASGTCGCGTKLLGCIEDAGLSPRCAAAVSSLVAGETPPDAGPSLGPCDLDADYYPAPGAAFCSPPMVGNCLGGTERCEQAICAGCSVEDCATLMGWWLPDGGVDPVCPLSPDCSAASLSCLASAAQSLSPPCAAALSFLLDQVRDGG